MRPVKQLYPILLFTSLLMLCSISSYAQPGWTVQDSIYFESIKNDTTALRAATVQHRGRKLAAKAQNWLGYRAMRRGAFAAADSELARTRRNYPNFEEAREARYFAGRVAWERKDMRAAKEAFEEYMRGNPYAEYQEGSHYYLIKTLRHVDDPGAVQEMRRFLRDRPGGYFAKDVQFHLVGYYRDKKDYANAITEARTLIQRYPGTNYAKDLCYEIGEYLFKSNRPQEALRHYKALADSSPANTEPAAIGQYRMATVYERTGDYTRARTEYARVRQRHPSVSNWGILSEYALAGLSFKEGMTRRDTGKTREAKTLFAQFVRRYPTDKRSPRAWHTLAVLARNAKSYPEALAAYDSVIAFDTTRVTNVVPDHLLMEYEAQKELVLTTHVSKGDLLRTECENSGAALQAYTAALAINPDYRQAMLGKAIALLNLNRRTEARPLLERLAREEGSGQQIARSYLAELFSDGGAQ